MRVASRPAVQAFTEDIHCIRSQCSKIPAVHRAVCAIITRMSTSVTAVARSVFSLHLRAVFHYVSYPVVAIMQLDCSLC